MQQKISAEGGRAGGKEEEAETAPNFFLPTTTLKNKSKVIHHVKLSIQSTVERESPTPEQKIIENRFSLHPVSF